MTFLTALWHAMPFGGWGWGTLALVAAGIIAAIALGFGPVLRGFVKTVVGLVPWDKWQTWLAIGAALAVASCWFWLAYHDAELEAKRKADVTAAAAAAKKEADEYWKDREKATTDAYSAQMATLRAQLATAQEQLAAAEKALGEALAKLKATQTQAFAVLQREKSRNVTDQANARCDLTRGVIVQFNAGAAAANSDSTAGAGAPAAPPAAGAGSDAVDASSGIALDSYVGAVTDTQQALGTCRIQVTGWQQHYQTILKPWIATAIAALNSCIPKGTP